MIECTAVSKTFRHWGRSVIALDGVDLVVERGEVFGLLGANGAGKTTLMKILLGLTAPTSGTVRLRGLDPRRAAARLKVGYLPEGHRIPAYLSGVAAMRLFGRLAGVAEPVLDRRIPELLELVGLAERGSDRAGRYSKGMTQRLGLAAALIDEPEVLFLDEPTDGVDPVGRRHIRDVLLQTRARGTTIFINSHLLSEVERTCTRISILNRGRVVREGNVEELTRPGQRYRVSLAQKEPPDLSSLHIPDTAIATGDGHLEVTAASVESLNLVIDRLRERGLLITEITHQRSDLEDVFIAAVGPRPPGSGSLAGQGPGRSDPDPGSPIPDPRREGGGQ